MGSGKKSKSIKFALYWLCGLFGIFIGFGLINFAFIGPNEAQKTEFAPVNYSDYVAILLTAITVLLAVMATFFALLAIVGYQVLRSAALNEATRAVMTQFEGDGEGISLLLNKLENNEQFQAKVAESLSSAGLRGINSLAASSVEETEDEASSGQ